MSLGVQGEKMAVEFLKRKGYKIVDRNYRNRFGEIDIIALHNGTVVFVEVKTRSSDEFGSPVEAVDRRKRSKMKNIALVYLKRFKKEVPARFDVVSIQVDGKRGKIDLVRNAFEI